KWGKGEGWDGKEAAEKMVQDAIERFQHSDYDSAQEAEQD
ncbi:inorganic pyrophosphatase, partial [Rothia kristinae]